VNVEIEPKTPRHYKVITDRIKKDYLHCSPKRQPILLILIQRSCLDEHRNYKRFFTSSSSVGIHLLLKSPHPGVVVL
jgi:hypothetical protein